MRIDPWLSQEVEGLILETLFVGIKSKGSKKIKGIF
jgi:hypothetical protein